MSEPIDCVDRQVNNDHGPGCKCEVDPATLPIQERTTIRLADLKPPPDPFAEFLTDLRDRVVAIEARQRAYGQHDPDCRLMKTAEQHAAEGWYYGEMTCTCWLSREAS